MLDFLRQHPIGSLCGGLIFVAFHAIRGRLRYGRWFRRCASITVEILDDIDSRTALVAVTSGKSLTVGPFELDDHNG